MKQFGTDKNGANCRDIRPHLKAIDHLFDIEFNYDTATYSIYFNGYLFRSAPFSMDKRDIDDVRKTYWINVNGNPFEEVDKNNERAQIAEDRRIHNLAEDLAKDIRKPLLNAI